MKEQLIAKLKQIVIDEKFKLDAYFLCGVASSLPNQDLQKAAEKYLAEVEGGADAEESTIAKLVDEMKKVIESTPKIHVRGDLVNNKPDIEWCYENRAAL